MDCELAEVLEFPPTEQEQLLSYLEQLERDYITPPLPSLQALLNNHLTEFTIGPHNVYMLNQHEGGVQDAVNSQTWFTGRRSYGYLAPRPPFRGGQPMANQKRTTRCGSIIRNHAEHLVNNLDSNLRNALRVLLSNDARLAELRLALGVKA